MKKRIYFFLLAFLSLCEGLYSSSYSFYSTPDKRTSQMTKALIRQAKKSIYIASYSLSWDTLITEINQKEGLDIKVILDTVPPLSLKNAEIKIDARSSLFHPKFIIVDNEHILIGSGNFTGSSFYLQHNNFLLLQDKKISKFLTKKFIAWWEEEKIEDTYQEDDIRIIFSPENDCEKIISEEISKAKKSIYFALYHFTSKPLAEAVIKRKFAGVNICGIIEDLSVEPHSVFRGLRNFGCNMRRSSRAGFLHSKYIIIDKEVVVTGSYNFSASAKRNNELVLIIKDKELASKFIREWQKNWRFYSLP